ncbi:anti-sigma factor [Caldilinea aerophila]|jgi:anti-sigma-K factor RskA|uniref:anti-sigma factor n=1 Tax=Caldilinea aerophila TaxID=133453 RepID=UPI000A071D86|nr:anti-sigma factor [Caldilinea aerophila]
MSQGLSYDEVMEMLPAYVLGALEADEMAAIEEYLQRHRLLEERLHMLRESTAQLALAAPVAAPPPRVKEALMARVRRETSPLPQTAVEPERRKPVNPLLRHALAGQKPARPSSSPFKASAPSAPPIASGRRFNFGWVAAAMIAAVMVLAIMLTNALYQNRLETLQQEIALRDKRLEEMNRQIEVLEQQFLGAQNQLAAFTQPDRVIPLTGTEAAPEVRGVFFQKNRSGVLLVQGLQPLPPSQTYQLWLIPPEGTPISAGLLGREGVTTDSVRTVAIPQEAEDFAAVGISIEPEGGSSSPTGPIVALG